MENGPFIDDFPIKTTIYMGFSMAMLNNQMAIQATPGEMIERQNVQAILTEFSRRWAISIFSGITRPGWNYA